MKVLVVGANGQIGKYLVQLLKESDHYTPVAMVRKEEQARAFEALGVETRLVDLEGSVQDIAEAAKACDAIVFTAGSGGQTGYDKTILIDLDGAAKTIEAAKQVGIDRYVMVSSIYANRREKWTMLQPYLAAKHYADRILEASGLTYTIIRPGILENEESTGEILIQAEVESGSIPRADVAKTIVETIQAENTYNRSFDLISGEDSVQDAVKNY